MSARILVADDDRSMCELLQTGLAKRGYEVTWRTSAKEAFDAVMEQDFDALVTDLNMPGTNGIELCEPGSEPGWCNGHFCHGYRIAELCDLLLAGKCDEQCRHERLVVGMVFQLSEFGSSDYF